MGDERTGIGEVLEMIVRPDWHKRAACRGRQDITWFPAPGQELDYRVAVRLCSGCDVRPECLEWSLRQPSDLQGIWGGLGHSARLRLQRRRGLPAGAPAAAQAG
jgi:WhiB family transcriptional regulator, redox-sensing transcriptional regulator